VLQLVNKILWCCMLFIAKISTTAAQLISQPVHRSSKFTIVWDFDFLLAANSRLRQCAANQIVMGSIPIAVIGIFHWHNPSVRTVALRSTHPLTNEYQGCLLGGKGSLCLGLTTFPSPCTDCVENLGALTFWSPKGLSRPVQEYLCLYLAANIGIKVWGLWRYVLRYLYSENVGVMFFPKRWHLYIKLHGITPQKTVELNPSATNVIYIYGAPILDVSRSHTTTQHSR